MGVTEDQPNEKSEYQATEEPTKESESQSNSYAMLLLRTNWQLADAFSKQPKGQPEGHSALPTVGYSGGRKD